MNRKISPPKKKALAKDRRSSFQLTRREVSLWVVIGFLAMVWMFTLGVIVGRQLLPVRFDIENLRGELTALKEQALRSQAAENKLDLGPSSDKMDFDFYEALTDKKEEARVKAVPKPQEEPLKPVAKLDTAPQLEPTTVRKTSDKKEEGQIKSIPKAPEEPSKPVAKLHIDPKPEPVVVTKNSEKERQGRDPGISSKKKEEGVESFTVQVLSLENVGKAEEMVSLLKSKGYAAYMVTAHIPGKGTYHRVRVGHFKDRNKARQVIGRLRQEAGGLEPIVLRE